MGFQRGGGVWDLQIKEEMFTSFILGVAGMSTTSTESNSESTFRGFGVAKEADPIHPNPIVSFWVYNVILTWNHPSLLNNASGFY